MKYRPLYPPSILGVMGSGQLGRMFTHSASKLGYQVHCYSPIFDSPTKLAGATEFVGKYTDLNKLGEFLDSVDALTFEFENIPEEALVYIEEYIETEGLRVFPSPKVIRTSNNRNTEKNFFRKIGIPVTNFLSLQGRFTDINKLSDIKFPAILKTNQFGYDGKGQRKYNTREDFLTDLISINNFDHILEEVVEFDLEVSVIGARFSNGKILTYPPSKNIHKNHILDLTIHPANISDKLKKEAEEHTKNLLEKIDYVGVLGLEFFVKDDLLLGNEFAPRPHNSGHYTIDAANFSQFDLQVLCLSGIVDELSLNTIPSVMKNMVGDEFFKDKDTIKKLIEKSDYSIHLYQKKEVLSGRKMGHINYKGDFNENLFLF